MSARGPHDDLDAAKAIVVAGLEAMGRGDLDSCRDLVNDEVEHITRDGALRGPGRLLDELSTQLERWRIDYELKELIDAGDGALIALVDVKRFDRAAGKLEWKAWPAFVVRILDGKVVFFEGYVDRRKAISTLRKTP